jgi:hypothetical protein
VTAKYQRPVASFNFPFRGGNRSMATGKLNAPKQGRPSKSVPPIKQFSQMKPGRPKPKAK